MKKVISSFSKTTGTIKEAPKPVEEPARNATHSDAGGESPKEGRSKRVCLFCQSKSKPSYTDLVTLRRFTTDRAKIVAKERSGVCSKHQRAVAKNIKYARHLSLLPFVPKV